MLVTFLRTFVTYSGTKLARLLYKVAVPSQKPRTDRTGVDTISADLYAFRHHLCVALKASRYTNLAFISTLVAGILATFVSGVCHAINMPFQTKPWRYRGQSKGALMASFREAHILDIAQIFNVS